MKLLTAPFYFMNETALLCIPSSKELHAPNINNNKQK